MTLPFENNSHLRKWQCFVCGKSHSDFEAFKAHVVETHDEGRDYVLCPLEHCGAPVRDIKLHFKAKHPSAGAPKAGQMRAMIWKDQTSGGKLKQRKPKFREGFFVSIKNGGKEMHYRSGMECEFYECLESIPEVVQYDVEKLRVPYVGPDGRAHTYHPDISVKYSDGSVEIWEIKPSSQTALEVNQCKWGAAKSFCEARGWEFVVLTEQGLNKLKKRIRLLKATPPDDYSSNISKM